MLFLNKYHNFYDDFSPADDDDLASIMLMLTLQILATTVIIIDMKYRVNIEQSVINTERGEIERQLIYICAYVC